MPQVKTPGVYIVEKNAFPNSVVEVPTAVPAFIGYTEKAMRGTTSLLNRPTRISSLAEYELYFGGPNKPVYSFEATAKPPDPGTTPAPAPAAQGLKLDPKQTTGKFYLYYSMRLFFNNLGGPCYIVSVGDYTKGIQKKDLLGAFDELLKEQEPTMIVIPDAVLLPQADWTDVCVQGLNHCGKMQSRVAILDVYGGSAARTYDGQTDIISGTDTGFRNKVTSDFLSYGMAYYPWVKTSIVDDSDIDYTFFSATDARAQLIKFLTAQGKSYFALAKDEDVQKNPKYVSLLEWIGKLDAAKDPVDKDKKPDRKEIQKIHQTLFAASSDYRDLMADLKADLNLLPPSGGMAGVYTRVDNNMGVFKAPANTGMASVVAPCVDITHDEQEDLNIPLDGKAINAIRTFPGRGVLIWGARTLDGNSQDWRYINVRRTLIMLEQSIKAAAGAYVFAPNNASTWVTVSNMIANFLTNQWKAGALVGATPAEAFSVDVGLGSTMTANDILEGYMLVTVKVAVVRPAEFIIITFQQKMQTS